MLGSMLLSSLSIAQSHARAAAVLVDEFDTGTLHSGLNFYTGSASAT